eukprot:TRINITY_DN282_c0_g1_i1.p1 TRINITY_DN282_c0_g1~~TRINITY_DN282_c0_g1_i1.p1  ORF type:complete len:210 (-),score=12.19 TRINITY_DN282_c0_g1_i1:68-697(-)
MCNCQFFKKQGIDVAGVFAVYTQKIIIFSWIFSIIPIVFDFWLMTELHRFVPVLLIPTLINWCVMACGFRGSYKRRVWQLFLYDVLAMVLVFFMTFHYTSSLYYEFHSFGHHAPSGKTIGCMIVGTLYFFVWMVSTILTIILSTQVIIFLRFRKNENVLLGVQKDVEQGMQMDHLPPVTVPQVAAPQVVYYYPLSTDTPTVPTVGIVNT